MASGNNGHDRRGKTKVLQNRLGWVAEPVDSTRGSVARFRY